VTIEKVVSSNETTVVVGAGISGMTTAIELANLGNKVILIEKEPYIGGRVTQLYKYFPKLCHPTCGFEINLQKIRASQDITVLTMAEVIDVAGSEGDFTLKVKVHPRYIKETCTACGDCTPALTSEFDDQYNLGMMKRKGIYRNNNNAYPNTYTIDPGLLGTDELAEAKKACKFDAIDEDMAEENIELTAGVVVWATGWTPYDAAKIQAYGYDRFDNVITNIELERMMDPYGPTGGKILRPSDNTEAKNVAFIQCAGSRDENHLPHCSRFCCMASLKQTHYLREKYDDDFEASIYYIDIRSIDRFEDFYKKVQNDDNVTFIKSKVASITEDDETKNPILHGVDTEGYHRYSNSHDLIVLAVGMESNVEKDILPEQIEVNRSNYIEDTSNLPGFYAAGCSTDALDVNRSVQQSTATALRALQSINHISKGNS